MAGASEVRLFTATIPPGTAIANPIVVSFAMPARTVKNIRWRIPPGPNGFVGFAIGSAGIPIIPANAGAWVIGSDEYSDWPLVNAMNSGAWQFLGYNLGIFPHTIYFQFQVELPDLPNVGSQISPLPPSSIETAGAPSTVLTNITIPPPPELT